MSKGTLIITIFGVIVLGLAIFISIWYLLMDESKKTYVKSLVKQIPQMPGRYSV
jgi:hypothetical protein